MGSTSASHRNRWPAVVALLVATPWACTDATSVELLEITGSGVLFGQVFLDLNGDGASTAGDAPLTGAGVLLVTSGTAEVVDQVTTDSVGAFALLGVPVGSYRLTLDPTVLGDSLSVLSSDAPVRVALGDTTRFDLGATFEELSLEDALLAPVGRRVFTHGIALNTRVNFDASGRVHFRGESSSLRGLNVARGVLNPGDSARLLGRVVSDNGRPALADVTPIVLVPLAAVVTPDEVTTAEAASAGGGLLDAELVRIRLAEITDTSTTVEGHFRFWADDGSDSVEFVIRDFLVPSITTSLFRPDTIVRVSEATGLLSPVLDGSGNVTWQFLPRSGSDVRLETKLADVAVATAIDTVEASVGDTVEMTVIATNNGPHRATSVQVSDTIPAGVDLVSASATAGSYSQGSGVWTVGDLAVGASDTLRIRVEITTPGPGAVTNIAELVQLLMESDPNAANDTDSATVTIS